MFRSIKDDEIMREKATLYFLTFCSSCYSLKAKLAIEIVVNVIPQSISSINKCSTTSPYTLSIHNLIHPLPGS